MSHIKPGHPKVLVAAAHGCEDTELVTIIDTLRRGDMEVIVGKVMGSKEQEKNNEDQLLCRLASGTKLVMNL